MKLPNNNLLTALKKKEHWALSDLYDSYAAALYGVILPIVKDEKLAQDILQETFLKIWSKIDSFDPNKAKLFTWMYQIARNGAIDATRKKKVHIQNIQEVEKNVSSYTSDQLLEKNELHRMMEQLEPKYKTVVSALFFNGMTQKEFSESSGIPLGTIKTRLRIALRELRFLYQESIVLFLLICTYYG